MTDKIPTPERPEVHMTIGGDMHRLVMDFNSLWEFTRLTGKNPYDSSVWSQLDPLTLVQAIFVMTRRDHIDLTEERIRERITLKESWDARQEFQRLWLAAFAPEFLAKKNDGGGAVKETPVPPTNGTMIAPKTKSTGSDSSASPASTSA